MVLTAAISQAACTVIQNTNSGTGGAAGSGTGGTAQGGSGTGGSAGSTASQGGANTGGTAGSTANEGGAATGGAGGAATGGAGGAATGGSGGAACNDTVGTPGDCAGLEGKTNCTTNGWEETYCKAAAPNLKPKVAQAVVGCFLAFTDCTAGDGYACWKNALAAACPDSNTTTDHLCALAGSTGSCTNATADADCHKMVDGLSATGITAVQTCLEGGACDALWTCIEGL